MSESTLPPSAQRVQQALQTLGFEGQVVELASSTRTALEAAESVGCTVGQIVKSLIFKLKPGETPVLLLVSGVNRVNEKSVGQQLGGKLDKADADFALRATGYAIGGIPPVGHATPLTPYIDEDLMNFDTVWAAAGTPHAVFQIPPAELLRITSGKVISVK